MQVFVNSDVYLVILNHAFSTEVEEIMGLLFGYTEEDNCFVLSLCILQRHDKRKDRVEIAPEQLYEAMAAAENVSKDLGKEVRVVGWYHSHPHITAFPSEVDIRTQWQYQSMDPGFIGLIVAVYSSDSKTHFNTMDTIFFHSISDAYGRLAYELLPFHVLPESKTEAKLSTSCVDSLASIPKIILREEIEAFQKIDVDAAPLNVAHNTAVYTKNTCKVMEGLILPILHVLSEIVQESRKEVEDLQNELDIQNSNG